MKAASWAFKKGGPQIAPRPAAAVDALRLPRRRFVGGKADRQHWHRYQIAAGVERDLRRCLADWEARGRIDDFPLGEHDAPDRLLIPEKLYGRAREVETLLASFDRTDGHGVHAIKRAAQQTER